MNDDRLEDLFSGRLFADFGIVAWRATTPIVTARQCRHFAPTDVGFVGWNCPVGPPEGPLARPEGPVGTSYSVPARISRPATRPDIRNFSPALRSHSIAPSVWNSESSLGGGGAIHKREFSAESRSNRGTAPTPGPVPRLTTPTLPITIVLIVMKPATRALFLLAPATFVFFGAETYQKPPKAIEDILNSPTTPTLSLSPNRAYALQGSPVRYPPIAELSEPMLRLAGIRINPKTNGLHNTIFQSNLLLRKIPEGTEIKITLPPNPKLGIGPWSPDGSRFVFTNSTQSGIEVWIGDAATGRAHRVPNVHLNEVFGGGGGRGGGGGGGPLQWMPDGKSLLMHAVRANRGAPPVEPTVPAGPHISESMGGEKGAPTYEDLLQNPHDEDLFEFYATTQLAVVDSASGAMQPIGKPAMIESARMSPDGKYFIVNYIHRPFSYSYPARQFPTEIEIWDRTGKMLKKEATIPMGGTGRGAGAAAAAADEENPVSAGPRGLTWLITDPSTLIWFEGTGGGGRGGRGGRGRGGAAPAANADGTPAPVHEKIMAMKPPFTGGEQPIYEADQRLEGFTFTENLHTAIIGAGGGGRGGGGGGAGRGAGRAQTAYLIDFANPKEPPKPLWTSGPSRFNNPGNPVEKSLPNGGRVGMQSRVIPAQLTTACTGPRSSSARRAQAATSAAAVRSAWTASTRAPSSEAAFSVSTAAWLVAVMAEADVPAGRGQPAHRGRADAA